MRTLKACKQMMKETFLGLMGGALCLTTTFATETIQPIDVNALIGLSAQDEDDPTGAGTTGHAHHVHHGHHGADAGSEHGPHLRISAGVNLISQTDLKGFSEGFKWDAGVELNVAYGIPVVGDLAVELGVGMTYNSLKEYVTAGTTRNADGGLWQVPLMAHLIYEFHLGESLVLGVSAGAGIQYNTFILDGVTPQFFGESESSWTFRYEAGLELTWPLSATSALGAYAKYAWVPGIEVTFDAEFETAGNMGFGVMYILEF